MQKAALQQSGSKAMNIDLWDHVAYFLRKLLHRSPILPVRIYPFLDSCVILFIKSKGGALMRVQPIPRRTLLLFMSVFLAEAQRRDSSSVSLQSDATKSLRERKDFHTVLRTLEALGHIRVAWTDNNIPLRVYLTDSGHAYLENSCEIKAEQRWTRGLAIAALIISLASLSISGLSLFLQYR